MGNISTKVNLGALKNAAIIMSGKNKDVECLLIPIAQNHLYKNDKGVVSLELIGFEIAPEKRKPDSKDTHLVKQSLSKEILEKLSDEEKKAFPILGNHVNLGAGTKCANLRLKHDEVHVGGVATGLK